MHHKNSKLVDTYELINHLLLKTPMSDLTYIIENRLPIIIGDPLEIEGIFKSFIEETINEFRNNTGILYFEYFNESFPSISVRLFSNTSTLETNPKEGALVEKITDFELFILLPNHKNLSENFEAKKHFSTRQKTG